MDNYDPYLSIVELSEAFREREVSPIEITERLLSRITLLDEELHSYETVLADRARKDAETAQNEMMQGKWRGPLHGVPVAVKDLYRTAFAPTKAGTRLYDTAFQHDSATVIERLAEAGAIIVGKLKMTEAAYTNHHPSVVPPVNPWNPDYWVGTSSTGPGVATAAGLCAGSLGSDTGGSIRFPSATCGLTGVKPTWGRVSRHGVVAMAPSLDHVGPMCRSAADAAVMLQAIAGRDPRDATSLDDPVPSYLGTATDVLDGLRVGIDRSYTRDGIDPRVVGALDEAERILTKAGARIMEVQLPNYRDMTSSWISLCSAELAAVHSETFPAREPEYGRELAQFLTLGRAVSGMSIAEIIRKRLEFSGALNRVLQNVDMLLAPTMPIVTPSLKELQYLGKDPDVLTELLRFTAPFNFSGSPSITLPNGIDDNGLPISMQFIGSRLKEDVLLHGAQAYQMLTAWHRQRPTFQLSRS